LFGVAAVDDHPRYPIVDGFGSSTGVPDENGDTGSAGFEEDNAKTFDVKSVSAGSTRHGEHIRRCIVERKIFVGDKVGEDDVVIHPKIPGQRVEVVGAGASSDNKEESFRFFCQNGGKGADEGVLSLTWDEPGDARDNGDMRANVMTFADELTTIGVGVEASGINSGGEPDESGMLAEGSTDTVSRVVGDVGDGVAAVADDP